MKKPLTYILSLTFLFLFSGSVYGKEEVKIEYWGKGKLYKEIHYNNGKREGLKTGWYESGEKWYEEHYKNAKKEGLETARYKNGRKKYS
jgi:antitoxin component YwqK of YwqJK toxin-antitoxin module